MLKGDVGRRPATDWPESVTKSRERHGNHAGNSHSSAAANIFHFFNMPANNMNTNTIASMFSIVVMWVLSMCGLRRCCLRRVQKYVTALSRSRPRPRPGGTICGGKGPVLLPCRVVSCRVVSCRATCAVEKRHYIRRLVFRAQFHFFASPFKCQYTFAAAGCARNWFREEVVQRP